MPRPPKLTLLLVPASLTRALLFGLLGKLCCPDFVKLLLGEALQTVTWRRGEGKGQSSCFCVKPFIRSGTIQERGAKCLVVSAVPARCPEAVLTFI